MELSKRLQADLKKQVRSEVRTRIRTDKEIDACCEKYRGWVNGEKRKGKRPVTVIAEGDSWGRYVAGFAMVYYLKKLLKIEINNLASPGDELREMLSDRQSKRLIRELQNGPARR